MPSLDPIPAVRTRTPRDARPAPRVSLPVAPAQVPSTSVRPPPRAVRVSVTDRCDMACVYCRPSRSEAYLPAEDRLDLGAWTRTLEGLRAAGLSRVRFTGGEPLLWPRVVDLVAVAVGLGFEDVALTTNGSRLRALAAPLRRAGLHRLNVSIDSLDPDRFREITRGGVLSQVLDGIDAARDAGFVGVKTNTVVLRGLNHLEIPAITQWAWSLDLVPRFIEVMGVGEGARIVDRTLVAMPEMVQLLGELLAPVRGPAETEPMRGPARYLGSSDGRHRVGFITGTSDTFCGTCDRLRVTSGGTLRPCLARTEGVPIDAAADVAGAVLRAWTEKPDAGWNGCNEASAADVSMRATGG